MPEDKTVWRMREHTRGKHLILENYLREWIPILGSKFPRIDIFDGFAGPGEYADGEPGSPLIVLKCIKKVKSESPININAIIHCHFLEGDSKRAKNLKNLIDQEEDDESVKVVVEEGKFEDVIPRILDRYDDDGHKLPPSFTMIDPFGVKDFSIGTIGRLFSYSSSECMITFMEESINRHRESKEFQRYLEPLVGTLAGLDEPEIEDPMQLIRDRFVSNLKKHGAKYVLPFTIWEVNRRKYTIFFATQSPKGCDVMKRSMWKVDETGAYQFREYGASKSNILRNNDKDLITRPFYNDLYREFRAKGWVTMSEITTFVAGDGTLFHSDQLKRKTLVPAEKRKFIICERPPTRRRGTFTDDVKVKFLKQMP